MDKSEIRLKAQNTFNSDLIVPPISIPAEWSISLLYPFQCAYARCLINTEKDSYSVYYDVDGSLGAVNEPYWEILLGDDCERFLSGKEKEMIEAIKRHEDKINE